jgi:Tol biopolymer transport system component
MKLVCLLLLLPSMLSAQSTVKKISNAYFNQPEPGAEAVLFAPETICDEFGNRDMAISPGGDELFYTFQYRGGFIFSTIMYSKKVNGKWSSPEVAAFCGQYNDLEPAFSPDGTKLYFSSNRPVDEKAKKDFDIWVVAKQNGVWGKPSNMGEPVNSAKNEFYPSIAKSGNLYFTKEMDGKDEDIVVCQWVDNRYDTAVSLPAAINTEGGEFNSFVDPEERFILFTGYKRKGNYGTGDLYISKKNDKGEWLEAKNMGDKVNSSGLTYCPYVSPDKKYLFFSSSRGIFKTPFTLPQNSKNLKKLMNSPLNGWDNIYWLEAKGLID